MSKRFLWRRIASDKSLFRRGLPGQVRRRRLHVESLEQRVVLDAGGFDVGGLAFGALDALGAGSAVAAAGALASDSASLIPLQVILGPMKFEYPQFPKMHNHVPDSGLWSLLIIIRQLLNKLFLPKQMKRQEDNISTNWSVGILIITWNLKPNYI
jgi:hypothetical protein